MNETSLNDLKAELYDMMLERAQKLGHKDVASVFRELEAARTAPKPEPETGGYDLNRAVFYGYMHGDNVVHGEQAFTMGPLRVYKLPDAGYVQVRVLVGWDL